MQIKLGTRVRDPITNFSGIATSKQVFLVGGRNRILVESHHVDGQQRELWFDEGRLEAVADNGAGGNYA